MTIETEPASVRGGNAANIVVVGTTVNVQSVLNDARGDKKVPGFLNSDREDDRHAEK